MAILDITHELETTVGFNNVILIDSTVFTNSFDMSDYDSGFMFTFLSSGLNDGTYVLTLQDSPDDSVWTNIPADKLNDPGGLGTLTVTTTIGFGEAIPRIGAFSTNKFVRGEIVATGLTGGAFIAAILTRTPEQTPVN